MAYTIEDINRIVEANQEFAVSFLQKVISIPSVTGEEHEISAFFEQWLKDHLNMEVKVYEKEAGRKNLVVDWPGILPGERFLFNGHMDVYPPAKEEPGRFGPWNPVIEDGYLYGRGAADMKSGTCATIMAVYLLKQMGYQPATGTISLSLCVDEENGGDAGVHYMLEQGECKADYGVCAEPTKHKVMVNGSGGFWYEITYRAQPVHPSLPFTHLDAIEKAHIAMKVLREYHARIHKERYYEPFGHGPSLHVTKIEGGEAENMRSSYCKLTIDRRLTPLENVPAAQKEFFDLLDGLKEQYPDMDYEAKLLTWDPDYHMDPNHKLVQAALSAYKAVTGKDTTTFERAGGSDAHKILHQYPEACIPNFGPSVEEESCTPDERVKIADYLDFIKVYMKMAMDLQG